MIENINLDEGNIKDETLRDKEQHIVTGLFPVFNLESVRQITQAEPHKGGTSAPACTEWALDLQSIAVLA